MELCEAPDAVEVSTFHFSQLRTLRLAKENERVPKNSVNIIAAASKYGLLFVGVENGFKVLKLENILDLDEDKENKTIEENYYCQLVTSETPVLISLSADQKTLAVCVNRNGAMVADMYDIAAFADPGETPTPFQNVTLSVNGSQLKDFRWNPVAVDIYAFCMSDGSLVVHELSGTALKVVASQPNAAATAVSWSPKGKQIVVGKTNGSFSQYKPTLQEVKNIPPPPLEEKVTVENICWVSTTQFVVLYVPIEKGCPYLFVVSTPKGAAIVYTNFYDICLGNSSSDDQRYFLHFEPIWGVVVCASTDSIEVAVIGDAPNWVQWDVKEDGKALLPGKDGATHAIGMGVMYCAQRNIVISEFESYPPMPIIFYLTNNGLLVSFHMVNNVPGLESLVRPSTPIDREGERKKPGMQNSNQRVVVPNNALQVPAAVPSSAVVPSQSPFQPLPVQENKTTAIFTSGSPSTFGTPATFGFNQTANQIGNEQIVDRMSSAHNVSSDSTSHIQHSSSPVSRMSTFSAPEEEKAHKLPSNISFTGPTSATSNAPKQTLTQSPYSGNLKEDLINQNTYMAAVIEEVQTFEKELQDLKSSLENFTSIGANEEMASLKAATLNSQDFQTQMSETVASLNSDIHDLKNVLLESFGMVEDANSRERRKNDHLYISLLRERALGPVTAKRMKKIEQHYLYLSTQLQEVSNKIDQDWFEYLEKKKAQQKTICQLSSAEAIYQILLNYQIVIHNLRKNLDLVCEKAAEKRLENISRRKNRTQFIKKSTKEELSELADSFLHVKITIDEEKSPKSKKLSPSAQKVLKNHFSSAKTNTVRPTVVHSLSQSRLISKSSMYNGSLKQCTSQSIDNNETRASTSSLIDAERLKIMNNRTTAVGNTQMEKLRNAKLGSSKIILPVMKSPSPKEPSSPSVSSSGGPFYEDITPPGSPSRPELMGYHPETLALLQELIAQSNYDEEKLNDLLNAVVRYNNGNSHLESISPTNSTSGEFPHVQEKSSQLQKEYLGSGMTSQRDLSFQPDTSTPSNFSTRSKPALNSSFVESAPGLQKKFPNEGDFALTQASRIPIEKPSSLFPSAQSSFTGIKTSENEGNNFGKTNLLSVTKTQSIFSDITANPAVGKSSNQTRQVVTIVTDTAKLDVPPNRSATSVAFLPTQSRTASFFDQSKTITVPDVRKVDSVSRGVKVTQTSVGSSVFSTASSITPPESSASVPVLPSMIPGGKSSTQPASSVSQLSETLQNTVSSSSNVLIDSSKVVNTVPSSLFSTSALSSEPKTSTSSFSFGSTLPDTKTTTTSSFVFGKAAFDSKVPVVSTAPSLLFSPLTTTKSDTLVTSSSSSVFGPITSLGSVSGSSSSTPSFFGQIPSSETNSTKGSTSFLFGPTTTQSAPQSTESSLPEIGESVTTSIATSEITTVASPTDVTSTISNTVLQRNSSFPTTSPVVAVIEGANTVLTPDSGVIPTIVSVSSLQSPDAKTSTTELSNLSSSSNITAAPAVFGSPVTSAQSPIANATLTSPPSTTSSVLFGQTTDNKSLFSSTSATQSFFGATEGTQSSFFGKPVPETTTAKPSFFGNSSLDTTSTTSSFFGKTTPETPGFGQSAFGQNTVFGSASATTTPAAGSFFSQSPGGSSVFGGAATNTSENSGFGNQSGGSFTFGKSPFGQTQGSFGLAKSVFGQSSTFGQPASPQTNSFGQSSSVNAFGQGSFFSGLGGKPSEENASKNVFALGGNIGKQNTESNVFGSSGASAFGAKTGAFTPGGFSSGAGSVSQSGFGAFQQTPQKSEGFGASPSFGGSPSFGSAPAFGSPPSFGSGNALGTVFGSSQQTANFANFASANSPTFGSLASQSPGFGSPQQQQPGFGQQQQQQGFGSASVFGGGSAFGSQPPSFGSPGGGQSNSSAFTQWRN